MIPSTVIDDVCRFWSKVDRSDGCWVWTAEKNNHGYGRFEFWHNGKRSRMLAHRLALILTGVNLTDQTVVRHSCDNPPCVKPEHLLLGTQSDNVRDAVDRGRADLSGLVSRYARPCRRCGAAFLGEPNRRYCDDHRPERNRRKIARQRDVA